MTYIDALARDMKVSAPPHFSWRHPYQYFTGVPWPVDYSMIWDQKRARRPRSSPKKT